MHSKPTPAPAPSARSSIGTSVDRRDGAHKVQGRTLYSADVRLDGTLHGAILRSSLPYARITRIDVNAARALPGVHAVLTGLDIPDRLAGRSLADVPILCRDVVRFIGDRVAAVAAETPAIAQQAMDLIEVEYDELEPVLEPHQALAPAAAILHPRFHEYIGAPKDPLPLRNLCAYALLSKGDVEAGLRAADIVVEHHYTTQMQHQGYLEPQACVAAFDLDGVLRIWASNKAPFLLRNEVARILDLPAEQLVVEPTFVGGDFGGKGTAMEIPLAAHLARASRRPVRIVLSGIEEFTSANPRHAAEITIRSGLTRDGCILARDIRVLFDGGAYAGYKPIPGVNLAAHFWSAGPYRTPNVRLESLVVYTNHVPAGHMRAPGIAQVAFAEEVDMDRLAEAVGMDPLVFRQRHALEDGDTGPLGERWQSMRLKECLERIEVAANWFTPKAADVGRGIAISHCAGGMGGSSASVEVLSTGQARLKTGVNDQGSGSHTILLQIVAHELMLPVDQVELIVGGTDTAPFDSGSSASRVTYVGGLAAQRAAAEVRQRMSALAAEYLGCPESQVELRDGVFVDVRQPVTAIPFADLAARAIPEGEPVLGQGHFQDFQLADTPSFAAMAVEVHVDRETGGFSILRMTGVYDLGTVLNPRGVNGQLAGGLIQGLGMACMEDLRLGDGGRVETASLADYKLPTSQDIATYESVWITDAPGTGPYGAKSIGELTTPLIPAALSNAVYDAVGVRIVDLPLSAERVYLALRALEGAGV
jgi:CO/xanthine dehydrogenase Mo-binding subunit